MDAHLSHFSLRERPFEIVTDPRFYYSSREHQEAMARLRYLVDEETMYFGMLTGEIGSGKTITRKVFLSQIDWQKHYVIEFENSAFSFDDLLRQLLVKSGQPRREIDDTTGSARLFELVAILATELRRLQNRQLVLLIDEAQDLSAENLLQFKRLSNLNGEIDGRITIILIGQSELREQVAVVPPLDQRISLRFHLPNLSPDEIAPYLAHRLRVAGHPTGDLFTPEAGAVLFSSSRGVPREINRLAKLSLELAASQAAPHIDESVVYSIVDDLRRHQTLPSAFAHRP